MHDRALSYCSHRYYYLLLMVAVILIYYYHFSESSPGHSSSSSSCPQNADLWEQLDFDQGNLAAFAVDDPRLVQYVRYRYLLPPSTKDYHLKNPGSKATAHSQLVRKLLKDKKNGVFIEAGANAGEVESHTLELEMELGWSGLLIECNPTVVPFLRSTNRKAWVGGVCLSGGEPFNVFNFSNPESWTYSGRIGEAWNLPVATNWTYFDVESVSLYTIILAAGYTEIDYFSFDVEGFELKVLKNFPFDKILIRIIIAEIYFLKEEERTELIDLLKKNGYELKEKMSIDWVFVHHTVT